MLEERQGWLASTDHKSWAEEVKRLYDALKAARGPEDEEDERPKAAAR
jgi:hypothetical protein